MSCGDSNLQAMGAKQTTVRFRQRLDDEEGKQLHLSYRDDGDGGGMVDITPPELISGLITENGVMTCEGVAEELIKLWF